MSPIELLDHLTVNKTPIEDIQLDKGMSVFMLNRWLSMSDDLIDIIDDFQEVTNRMSLENVYQLYLEYLPASKFYFKYVKADKSSKYSKELIDILYKRLEFSMKDIDMFLDIVTNSDLKEYLTGLGYDKKQVTKLMKKT